MLKRRGGSLVLLASMAVTGRAQTGPLSFDAVVEAAGSKHPLVEAARARVRAAEAGRQTAGVLPNPIATYQVENAPFPGSQQPPGVDREASAFLTIPLEWLYQRGPRVQRAEQEIAVAKAELLTARWVVIQNAVRAFDRFALARLAVENGIDVRKGLDSLVEFNTARLREGATAEAELIRARIEQARADLDETTAQVELARAAGELRPFLEDDVSLDLTTIPVSPNADESSLFAGPIPSFSELSDRTKTRQPELAAARYRVAASRTAEHFQRTLTIRQVGVTFGSKRIGRENTMIAGVSVPLPLFDRNRGEVARALAEATAAERELEWIERLVTSRLRAAYEAGVILHEQTRRLGPGLILRAEEARSIALGAYREGAVTLLQVLDASRTLGQVRMTYYQTHFAAREARVALAAASGAEPGELSPEGGAR